MFRIRVRITMYRNHAFVHSSLALALLRPFLLQGSALTYRWSALAYCYNEVKPTETALSRAKRLEGHPMHSVHSIVHGLIAQLNPMPLHTSSTTFGL